MKTIYDFALTSSNFETFTSVSLAEDMHNSFSARLLECSRPLGRTLLGRDARKDEDSKSSKSGSEENDDARKKEEEARMERNVTTLQQITGCVFSAEYARKALEMSEGNINLAAEHLYSGRVEACIKGGSAE